MATVEHGELQVVVPVGFLLAEAQEVTVSVDRPGGAPLPVRLRLIPARATETVGVATLAEEHDEPVSVSSPTPVRLPWPKRAPGRRHLRRTGVRRRRLIAPFAVTRSTPLRPAPRPGAGLLALPRACPDAYASGCGPHGDPPCAFSLPVWSPCA